MLPEIGIGALITSSNKFEKQKRKEYTEMGNYEAQISGKSLLIASVFSKK